MVFLSFSCFYWVAKSCRSLSGNFPSWNMADKTDTEKIVDYLKRCPGKTAPVSDIVNGIGVPRQQLNTLLHQMKRSRVAFERRTTPPKWSLCNEVG